jgi:zinc protease
MPRPSLRPALGAPLARRLAPALCALLLVACPARKPPVDAGSAAPTQGVVVTPSAQGTRVTIDGGYVVTVPTDPDAPLPWDEGVSTGVLPNGLRWYVEQNAVPDDRVELWLAVRIGSVHEDDDQQGLAHLLEHMAFNGTEHFPGNTLITYLESVGTRFGAHLNAHTSFEETVYKLQVPTDEEELLSKGFVVLSDWAGGLSLLDEAIEGERGVVMEEWRRGRGAARRSWEATAGLRYRGAPHAVRQPIGTQESLETFTPDAVRRLYADWYRPDLMAVIVVGDIDPADAQRRIEEAFGGLTGPAEPRPRPPIAVPPHDETLVAITTDPEQRSSYASLTHKFADVEQVSHRAYREGLVARLYARVMQERFRELSRDPASPLRGAWVGQSRMTPTTSTQAVSASSQGGKELQALSIALEEVERGRRFGVLPSELDRARAATLDGYRSSWVDRDNNESRNVLQELVRNFTSGENVPGIGYEYAMASIWVPSITVEEVNAYAAAFLPDGSRVAVVTRPGGDWPALTEADVLATLDGAAKAELTAPVDVQVPEALVADPPEPGAIVATIRDEDLGTVEWTFSNGAHVILKTTDFKEDEVRFMGWTPGGTSRVADADWIPASTATSIATRSGAGPFDSRQIEAYLAGRKANATVWMAETSQGIQGAAAPKDLPAALELAFLKLVEPRFTEEGFGLEERAMREQVTHRLNDPDTRFWDAWDALLWGDHPRHQPPTAATVEQLDRARSEAIYREAFGTIGAGTFVVVGAVDEATLAPLAARWIGSLPGGDPGSFEDVRGPLPEGARADSLQAGMEPKGHHRLQVHGSFESTPDSRHRLRALGKSLSIRLRELLREEMGGTYSVGARTWDTREPTEQYGIVVDFQCDPDRLPELRKAAWQVLEQAVAAPMDASVTQRVAEQERRSWEPELKSNAYWLNGLSGARRRGEDPSELARYRTLWERITPEYVHEAAREFLDLNRYVLLTQTPE